MKAALKESEKSGKKAKAVTTQKPVRPDKPPPKGEGKPGCCQKVGCHQKITGWTKTNRWKLCATCLLNVRTKGITVKLRDGSEFEPRKHAHALICQMDKADCLEGDIAKRMSEHAHEIHEAKAMKVEKTEKAKSSKRKVAVDQEADSDNEPSLNALKNSKSAQKKPRVTPSVKAGTDARVFIQQQMRKKAIEKGMNSD
jgi:hypothetical protein